MDKDTIKIKDDLTCEVFQKQVDNVLIRHKSILDITTKLDEYNSRINRAVVKSVTSCGCIKIHAKKQDYTKESLEEIKDNMESHVEGELCSICEEIIEEEIGAYMFYLAALCNSLNLDLSNSILKEYSNIKALGIFSLK